MFKKALFTGLILILSANAAFSALVSPDSVFGNFTKCKTHLWKVENYGPNYTNDLISSSQYTKKGKISSEVSKYGDGTPSQTTKYKYDDRDEIQEVALYNKDGILSYKMLYSTSNDTFKTQRINYDKGKERASYSYIIRDKKGNVIEYFSLDRIFEDYEKITKETNKYDDKNSIILETSYEKAESFNSTDKDTFVYKYKYDDAGRILETTKLNTGYIIETYYNKYDAAGRLLETSYLKPGGTIEVISYYKYEDNGCKTKYINEISNVNYIRRIERYNEKDKVIEEIECTPNGVQKSKLTRKYDKDRLIEVVKYDQGDTIKEKRIYEYDKYGNCTKDVTYSPSNEPTRTVEYAYSK